MKKRECEKQLPIYNLAYYGVSITVITCLGFKLSFFSKVQIRPNQASQTQQLMPLSVQFMCCLFSS